ncbi:MAG: substrate-binding domain-containing protein, partial [Pseudomonadota bacterium]
LGEIRQRMASNAMFRGFGPAVMAMTGLIAFATAAAQTIWPALTTVAQPFEKMAAESIRLLSDIGGRSSDAQKAEMIVIPHEIIVRGSCARQR